MTWVDGRRIVRGVSGDAGTASGLPDPLLQDLQVWPGPAVLPSDLSQQLDIRRGHERSREDAAQQGDKKPSLWKRLLGRRGHVAR